MGDKTFLLADSLHINDRNFSSLLKYCASRDVDIVRAKHDHLPIDAFGDYTAKADFLTSWRHSMDGAQMANLSSLKRRGVNVFDVARAEILSLLCTQTEWFNAPFPTSREALFSRLFESHLPVLLDNMAAACAWIDFWEKTLQETPRLAYVGVFSGSLIYARTLLELMRFRPARCLVLESFFTGQHYYLEERYQPLANRSDISLRTVFRSLKRPIEAKAFEARRDAILQQLTRMKNKNVSQPLSTGERLFRNGQHTVLIMGQVLNDFSLLEIDDLGMNSLEIYKQAIQQVLTQTTYNVVFKAHPWERKKANIRRALTMQELARHFGEDSRVKLVEDYPLVDLFSESDIVFCVCSQGGIEAALAGFKPVQVGNAFWGKRGFSHDLSPLDQEGWVSVLNDSRQWRLSLVGYDALMDWLVAVLDGWLVEEDSGVRADTRLGAILHEIAGRSPKPLAVATSVKPTPSNAPSSRQGKKEEAKLEPIPKASLPSQASTIQRKFRKFLRRPDEFFRDAKSVTIRRAGLYLLGK